MGSTSQPTFSVIIPTHKRPSLLRRAILSVLAQTFANFELLVVDDASNDGTQALVSAISDPRVVYIRREKNGGAAATRNSGICQAIGRYISFLDDDDELHPQFLAETYTTLENSPADVGLSWCGVQVVQDTHKGEFVVDQYVWQPQFANREAAYLSFLQSRRIGTNFGITVRRSCFDIVGLFDESLKKAEDTDFLIRIVRHFDFVVIPQILMSIHQHSGPKLTVYDERMAEAYEVIIQKNLETLRWNPGLLASKHHKTAWLYYHGGHKSKAREHMWKAICINPLQLQRWLMWFMFEVLGSMGPVLHRKLSSWKNKLSWIGSAS